MICAIVICALLAGGGPRQCEADSMQAFYLSEPQSRRECKETFDMLKHVLPANLRLVQFDWYRQPVQEARKP